MKLSIIQAQIIRDMMNAPEAIKSVFQADMDTCICVDELAAKTMEAHNLAILVNSILPDTEEKVNINAHRVVAELMANYLCEAASLVKEFSIPT